MAWNDPKDPGQRDPWGSRNGSGPPDLDELIRNLQKKLRGLFGGKGGRGTRPEQGSAGFLWGVVLLLVVLWLASGLYRINEGERGVVLRFGKYQNTTNPGLSWHIPFPIESYERVNIGRIRTLEVGYRTDGRAMNKGTVPLESLMLTEDENIVQIEFAVQYRVKDARAYLFNVVDPEGTLQQVTESATREVVGKSRMDYILTDGRNQVTQQMAEMVQQLLDRYQTGLEATSVNMQDAQPPEQVQAAFSDAVKAREDEQRLINEAEAYRNEISPRARGEAARVLADARAYREEVIERSTGEAGRFLKVYNEYREAPAVTRQRLYLETMERILRANRKVIVDTGDGGSNLLYLPVDKLLGGELPARGASGLSQRVPPVSGAEESTPPRDLTRGREVRR